MSMIMRLAAVVLLALQYKWTIVSGDDEKEHVHFKIYVPEIIKHRIHTKTVLIHVYDPKKKAAPKKNEHVVSHHEDWNIRSSYNNYNEHSDAGSSEHSLMAIKAHGGESPEHGQGQHHQGQNENYATPYGGLRTSPGFTPRPIDSAYPSFYREHPERPVPHYDRVNYQSVNDHHPGSHPVPVKSVFRNGVTGYSYPPQYAVGENVVEDVPENSFENNSNLHGEGHSETGLHSETGHLFTNELTDFYDDKNEESHETLSMESKEIEESKNHDSYGYVGDEYLTTSMMII